MPKLFRFSGFHNVVVRFENALPGTGIKCPPPQRVDVLFQAPASRPARFTTFSGDIAGTKCDTCRALCCSVVLPLEIGPAGAFRGPREVPCTYEKHKTLRPQHPPCRGVAGVEASVYYMFTCMRNLVGPPEGPERPDLKRKC